MEEINIDVFKKLEIKICTIIKAEALPNSDKLLRLILDIGNGEERQILSGIAQTFPDPQVLINKQIPVLLNLEPRKMRGEFSNGMILAASDENNNAVLLHPTHTVLPGTQVS